MGEKREVFLVDAISRVPMRARLLVDLSLSALEDAETIWRITSRTLQEQQEALGEPKATSLEHEHWDWAAKLREFGEEGHFYGIERDGLMQGLMLLRFDRFGRLSAQRGKPLVYVDYVEAAPWNLVTLGQPRFRSVGTTFLKVAIQESLGKGWEGRIGLHSLPQAEGFYQHLGMTAQGADEDYYGLGYFEITPRQAVQLLER